MKNLAVILLFLFTLNVTGQSDLNDRERNRPLALTVTQDGKLTFYKDDAGNVPFTLDLTVKMEWRGYSTKTGYFSLIPNFEFAELAGGNYLSYGVWGGYTFDELLELPTFGALNEDYIDIDLMPYVGANYIARQWEGSSNAWTTYTPSIHFGLEVTFKVHKKIGIVWDFKYNRRTDLIGEYSNFDEEFSFNFGWGIKYEFH